MPPYRLDLTVSVLRRLPSNLVDVFTADGRYIRALRRERSAVIAYVEQLQPGLLSVVIEGAVQDQDAILEMVGRMLGADRDLTPFEKAAARLDWLSPLAARMRGVRPPRYGSLWEAFVNVVAFQQLSLRAASAIVERLILASEPSIQADGAMIHPFPTPERFLASEDGALRALGLSERKIATLRRAAEDIVTGALTASALDRIASTDAARRLQEIDGIGPWSAAVILLRGLGRLDVFPGNDTSVARNLSLVGAPAGLDLDRIVDALKPQQGMLYYHLLLARLEARGELGRPSIQVGPAG